MNQPRFLTLLSLTAAVSGMLVLALLPGCASAPLDSVKGGQELEGWRTVDENGTPMDYFYMKVGGRASDRAIDRGDSVMMKTTCVESTTLQAQDKIIRKMLGETVSAESGTLDGQTTAYVITSMRKGMIRGTEMKECAPTDSQKSWLNCECVHFVKGKNLRKQFDLEVKNLSNQ